MPETRTPFRRLEEVFAFLDSLANFEKGRTPASKRDFRLDRMRTLLGAFGDPHRSFRSFHVAGTKGKGSTAALLAAVLQAAGIRTGLYTSPHVVSYLERFSVDGEPPETERVLSLAGMIRGRMPEWRELAGGFGPTTFEILTLLAMLTFRDCGCAYAVVETGIGGRLDATNVVDPEAAVITPLDLEHTDLLGESIREIAREKGGIIKPGVPVFCGHVAAEAREVLRRIAADRGSPIRFLADETERSAVEVGWGGTDVRLRLRGDSEASFHVSLVGTFQAENAALAFLTLRKTMPELPLSAYEKGFAAASLPGRWEILQENPPVILDGAHTPLAVRRLLETYRQLCPVPGVLIFGSVVGKRADRMAEILAPHFDAIIVSTPSTFKESDPEAVYALFQALGAAVYLQTDPEEALDAAQKAAGGVKPVLVTGSFYMLSEIRRIWMRRKQGG